MIGNSIDKRKSDYNHAVGFLAEVFYELEALLEMLYFLDEALDLTRKPF